MLVSAAGPVACEAWVDLMRWVRRKSRNQAEVARKYLDCSTDQCQEYRMESMVSN